MIKETDQRVVKVYFKGESFWNEDCYDMVFNFSYIEGVDNPDKYQINSWLEKDLRVFLPIVLARQLEVTSPSIVRNIRTCDSRAWF